MNGINTYIFSSIMYWKLENEENLSNLSENLLELYPVLWNFLVSFPFISYNIFSQWWTVTNCLVLHRGWTSHTVSVEQWMYYGMVQNQSTTKHVQYEDTVLKILYMFMYHNSNIYTVRYHFTMFFLLSKTLCHCVIFPIAIVPLQCDFTCYGTL